MIDKPELVEQLLLPEEEKFKAILAKLEHKINFNRNQIEGLKEKLTFLQNKLGVTTHD
ncbi:MAG: hypothetical protein ACXADY_04060 [Candidatus Hodarchaeales archaeon]|jgi:hypothetical protein